MMRFENPIGGYDQELNSFLYLLSNRNINNSLLSYCLCSKLHLKPMCLNLLNPFDSGRRIISWNNCHLQLQLKAETFHTQ